MHNTQAIQRSRLSGAADPNATLAALSGPGFGRYREAWAMAESGVRPEHPLHLDVDVTTACNFRCQMCPAGNDRHFFPGFKPGLFLDREMYRKALAEGAVFGLPSIRLGMTGEPLLVPDIDDWVREAKSSGVLDISLITNARLLTPDVSGRLIEAGLTRLMISVDAGSVDVYSKVRPGGDWDILLHNIFAFLRTRSEKKSITPLLRVSFVEMEINKNEREKFLEIFEPLADYISFQRYSNIFGAANTQLGQGVAETENRFCAEPFTRLALHADGGLFPCCADFGRTRPLGNLKDGSLLATWQSEAARRLCRPEAKKAEPCCRCLAASRA